MNRMITGKAYVLGDNVDTDQIIPAHYLTYNPAVPEEYKMFGKYALSGVPVAQGGLPKGHIPFHDAKDEFVSPYKIIIGGKNFGCGSSREHAPWALTDYGFRAVIAPSFGEIFFNNSYKNGLLPIVLSESQVDHLFDEVNAFPGFRLTIDLPEQAVVLGDGTRYAFAIDPFRKYCMVNGLDDIGLTLRHAEKIREYEVRRRASQPWLFGGQS